MASDRSASSTTSRVAAIRSRAAGADRKSTRLNSSHLGISYAVFGLQKETGAVDDRRRPVRLIWGGQAGGGDAGGGAGAAARRRTHSEYGGHDGQTATRSGEAHAT